MMMVMIVVVCEIWIQTRESMRDTTNSILQQTKNPCKHCKLSPFFFVLNIYQFKNKLLEFF